MPFLSRLDRLAIAEAEALGVSVSELFNHYKATAGTSPKSLQSAALQFLEGKENAGRSATYLHQMEWAILRFVTGVGGAKNVSELTLRDVVNWIGKGNAQTRATKVARLRTFLKWCKRQGYCREVLTDRLEAIDKPMGEPVILSNEEMRNLLAAAAETDPDMLEYLWLSGALGIRRTEIFKLPKGAVNWEEGFVVIGAGIAKNRSRRLVKVVAPLPKKSGVLLHQKWRVNFRKRFDAIASAAEIKPWPRNALRHTAASHLGHYFSDENKLAEHLGNSPQMIHRHYRGLVTPRQSEEFWALWS